MAASIEIPDDWQRSAALIARHRWRTVLVLGAIDRGKSTYCAFLTHSLIAAGEAVAFVDADVGQKDLGPPAAITLGYFVPGGRSRRVRIAGFHFVGSTSPWAHLLPMVVGTARLCAAARADRVIVNTTGLVHGVGRTLKAHKIEATQPDAIVALAAGDELDALLHPYRHRRIVRLRPAARATAKPLAEKNARRQRAFAEYLRSARRLTLSLDAVAVQRTLLFNGTPTADAQALYAENTAEGIVAVARPPSPPIQRRGRIELPAGFEHHLLCGLADRTDACLGLGTIDHFDYARRTVSLVTPVAPQRIAALQLGDMYVTPAGEELGRRRL